MPSPEQVAGVILGVTALLALFGAIMFALAILTSGRDDTHHDRH